VNLYPYWWDSAPGASPEPAPAHTPSRDAGTLPARADVVVIGAGYTGLAAARTLARAGASVVVVERASIGAGASSRNGGQVLTGMKLDAATLVARFGERRARGLFDASLESIAGLEQLVADEGLACEYERTGHIQAASKPSHFEEMRADQALLARVFDHPVELVSAADQGAELGSAVYHGLLIDRRSGALNPALYVRQLAAAACRAGATIVARTAVEGVRRAESAWTVRTAAGAVAARELFVATNGYTTAVTPFLQRRLVPIGSYCIATERLPAADATRLIPKRRMVFDSKHFLHYFRVTADHRLVFGGRAEFAPATDETTTRCADILRRDMVTVFPSLAAARIEYAWSGNVAFTRDQMPHAGCLDGAYYAAGYCGHGVAMATHLGALVARRMAGERFEHPLLDKGFAAIPFYRGTPWFLPIAGAYYQLLDWLQ